MRKYIANSIKKSVLKIRGISRDKFIDCFINPECDFTRNRKLTLQTMVKTGLLKSGTSLNQELRLAMGIGENRASSSAYIQQRDKLTIQFYRRLFEYFKVDYTKLDPSIKGKYHVLACDGSDVNIHPNREDTNTLVKLSNNPHDKACNQIHLNALTLEPAGIFHRL